MKYVILYNASARTAHVVGPFDTEQEAIEYRRNHDFYQARPILRVVPPGSRCSGKYPYHHGADETCPLCAPKE